MIDINAALQKLFLWVWLCILLGGICYIFWFSEWRYSQPTPVPSGYKVIQNSTYVAIAGKLPLSKDKPVLLHFFNPACPCSRFNMPHFKSLVKNYGNSLYVAMVVIDKTHQYTAEEIRHKYDLNIPVVFDTSIATICGVYSTPQAVILDKQHYLYYRGNYNKSRYCTNKADDYARIAIDSLLNNSAYSATDGQAYKAYGCQIFSCAKK